jgi:uncharacterized FlaG/YvyC family protein
VNFIEASTPVFDGKLPDRSDVFIDTNEDTESYGQWDADLYWSRNETFPAANKLPVTIDTAAIAKDQLDLQVSQSRVKAGEDAIVEYNITNTAAQSIQSPSIHMGSVPKKLQLKRITSTDGTFDSSNKTLRYEEIGSGETKTGSIVLSITKDTAGNYTFTIEGKLSNSVVDTATTTVQVDEPRQQSQKNDTTDDTSSGNEKKQQRRQAYDILLGFDGVEFVNENTVKANVYVKNQADSRLNNPTVKITPPDGMQITDPIGGQTVSGEKAHEWTLSAIEPSEQRELTITMEQTNGELSSDAEITAEVMLLDESVVSTTAEYRGSEGFLSSELPLSGDSTPGFGFLPAICGLVTVLVVIRAVRM